jgi:hypothetical protein
MHEINGCGDYLFAVCDFAPRFVFLSQLGFSTILALYSFSIPTWGAISLGQSQLHFFVNIM